MKLNELEERLPALYLAACEDGGAVPYIVSPPGVGKTSTVRQFVPRMKQVDPQGNYGYVELNGACLNLATIGGYLQLGQTYNGKLMSTFSLPYWWFTKEGKALDEYDGGVILIDEADKIPPDEKKIVGEAALSKVFASHRLPAGWVVFFAANRQQDKSGSTRDLAHLITRRRDIPIRPDTEAWAEWARGHGLFPEVITFAEENPTLLFEEVPTELRPYCCPRGVHQADIHLKSLMESFKLDKIPLDPITEEEIAGGIGSAAAAQLFKTIRMGQELPSWESVLASPLTAEVPQKPDGKRLMSYRMADMLAANPKQSNKIVQYMSRFEAEFQVIFTRLAINRNFKLVFDPAISEWCDRNASLIHIVQQYKSR